MYYKKNIYEKIDNKKSTNILKYILIFHYEFEGGRDLASCKAWRVNLLQYNKVRVFQSTDLHL